MLMEIFFYRLVGTLGTLHLCVCKYKEHYCGTTLREVKLW